MKRVTRLQGTGYRVQVRIPPTVPYPLSPVPFRLSPVPCSLFPSRRVWRCIWAGFLLALTCPLLPVPCQAATKIFLKSNNQAVSLIKPPSGRLFWNANTTQGTTVANAYGTSIAGPLTGHYWPIATANYTVNGGGGEKLAWFSQPLSSAVTISGTITPNIWGLESNNACNCGLRYEVLRWSVAQGGIVSSLGISTDDGVTEWTTSATVRTAPTLSPTSTDFVTGDRIVIVLYSDDANGTTQGSGKTFTIHLAAATGVDGDTYLSFTETISLSADSNNARAIPSVGWLLRPLLYWWKEYFGEVFG